MSHPIIDLLNPGGVAKEDVRKIACKINPAFARYVRYFGGLETTHHYGKPSPSFVFNPQSFCQEKLGRDYDPDDMEARDAIDEVFIEIANGQDDDDPFSAECHYTLLDSPHWEYRPVGIVADNIALTR